MIELASMEAHVFRADSKGYETRLFINIETESLPEPPTRTRLTR
jgi:hypothetical protein